MFEVEEVSLNDIEDDTLSGVEAAEAEILIPREVLEGSEGPVRMASLLFRNKSGLLPERLEGNDNDRLVCVEHLSDSIYNIIVHAYLHPS